jgi:hypothetical protein
MIRPLPENRLRGKQVWARTSAEAASMPDMVVRTIPMGSANHRRPRVTCLGNLPMLRPSNIRTKLILAHSIKVAVRGETAMMMVIQLG